MDDDNIAARDTARKYTLWRTISHVFAASIVLYFIYGMYNDMQEHESLKNYRFNIMLIFYMPGLLLILWNYFFPAIRKEHRG